MALPKWDGHVIIFGPHYPMDKDAEFILDSVKAMSYTAVKGGVAEDAENHKRLFDEWGIKCVGLYTSINRQPDVDELIAQLQTLYCRYLCNSGILAGQGRDLAREHRPSKRDGRPPARQWHRLPLSQPR